MFICLHILFASVFSSTTEHYVNWLFYEKSSGKKLKLCRKDEANFALEQRILLTQDFELQ